MLFCDFTLQILECVTINLALVYALLAYVAIKQKDFSTVYVSFVVFWEGAGEGVAM